MQYKDLELDWDEGNIHKIRVRFDLAVIEAFFFQDLFITPDSEHSNFEERQIAIGNGPGNKLMLVCFTIRSEKIRVISARFMKLKEVMRYEEAKKIEKA